MTIAIGGSSNSQAYDSSTGSIKTTPQSLAADVPVFPASTQLTATGFTVAVPVGGKTLHSVAYTIAATFTSVTIAYEASLDGTNFFEVDSAAQVAIGTYSMTAPSRPYHSVRGRFEAESGGTAATVSFQFRSSK